MITREMFEDALKDLQDDGLVVVAGRSSIRICHWPYPFSCIPTSRIAITLVSTQMNGSSCPYIYTLRGKLKCWNSKKGS